MSYKHLTPEERYVIFHLTQYGLSFREIGRRLNRHHSSISRELRRNCLLLYPSSGPPFGVKHALQFQHRLKSLRCQVNFTSFQILYTFFQLFQKKPALSGLTVIIITDNYTTSVTFTFPFITK